MEMTLLLVPSARHAFGQSRLTLLDVLPLLRGNCLPPDRTELAHRDGSGWLTVVSAACSHREALESVGSCSVSRAVCPGSFDPITVGHLDVISRAADLYEEVVIAVGSNQSKNALFAPAERVAMIEEACRDWPSVRVTPFSGLLVEFCREHQIAVIVKGLRTGADFDYELAMAQMNRRLTGVDTAFLPTAPDLSYVSSSLVREVASLGGDVTPFVTPGVLAKISQRLAERRR